MFGSSYPQLFVGGLISYLCCSCLFAYSSFQHSVLLYIFTFLVPCRNHNPVLSSFMIYHRVCNKINTTGITCWAGTAYPSGAPAFTPGFQGGFVTRSLVVLLIFLQIVVCPFVLFLLVIVLSFLVRFTVSDYPLSIFNLFLCAYRLQITNDVCKHESVRETETVTHYIFLKNQMDFYFRFLIFIPNIEDFNISKCIYMHW